MTARDSMMTVLDRALAYAARGWKVFPVWWPQDGRCACGNPNCNRPAKHPIGRLVPNGSRDATTDEADIRRWFTQYPNANIGIETGRESNLTVVDADAGGGKPGVINLTRLCAERGGVPPTLRVKTGGGGLHLYFRHSDALATGTNVLAEAIDVRNDGGYVIAPPSRHMSGATYSFVDEDVELIEVPEWLRPQARSHRRGRPRTRAPRRLTLDQVRAALRHVDAGDRDRWLQVGLILGRHFERSEEAWALYEEWSRRSPLFEDDPASNLARMRDMFYRRSTEARPRGGEQIGMGSLIEWAREGGWTFEPEGVEAYEQFYAVRPAAKFLYVPSGALWPSEAVNAVLPPRPVAHDEIGAAVYVMPAKWLMQNRGVDSVVFDPDLPFISEGKVAREQGVVDVEGATLLNRYQPSMLEGGDSSKGERWAAHVRKLFPREAEAEHLIRWCAHRVQRPGEKVRHALLIGGPPGVGKDTIFEAMLPALGAWNCAAIAPDALFGAFNEFAARVFLRINEVVDLHEVNRFKFFEATKTLIAGSPDYIEINPKYGTKFYARNCCGVVMTTNHATTGIYLTPDDRRHFAVETVPLWGDEGERAEYFLRLWRWLLVEGGFADVAAYLRAVDLRDFDPNRPPPKTETFRAIVANGMSGDAWLTDALDQLGMRPMVRADELRETCGRMGMKPEDFARRLAPAMARAGYEQLPNPQRDDRRHNLKAQDGRRAIVSVYVARGTPSADLAALLAGIERPRF